MGRPQGGDVVEGMQVSPWEVGLCDLDSLAELLRVCKPTHLYLFLSNVCWVRTGAGHVEAFRNICRK